MQAGIVATSKLPLEVVEQSVWHEGKCRLVASNCETRPRFYRKALKRHGQPDRVVIDGSQTNREAIASCDTTHRLQERSRRRLKPIRIRQSRYLYNRIEQDHRRIKRRVRPMLGFKSFASACAILDGIEMVAICASDRRGTPSIRIRLSPSSLPSSPPLNASGAE
jgi:transposase-like protein